MNVYQTDLNGVYVGTTTADQDPLNRYLLQNYSNSHYEILTNKLPDTFALLAVVA
jgi:hypothetical protein